jgi:hypothetical protein
MKDIILLLTIILFSQCSPSWHIKRALKKDPSIFKVETITTIDTVYINVPKIDTVFTYSFDTVVYWQDKIKVKYHYSTVDSLVFIQVDCPPKQVIREKKEVKETIITDKSWLEKLKSNTLLIVSILIAGSVFFLAMYLIKKFI